MKTTSLDKLFTPKQARRCIEIVRNYDLAEAVDLLETEIMEPNLAAIEKAVGQECHPRYLAYAVAHAVQSTGAHL